MQKTTLQSLFHIQLQYYSADGYLSALCDLRFGASFQR